MPNLPPLRRFFQPQVPQMFRPTVSSVLAKTVGRINVEPSTNGLTAIAYWLRFAQWCRNHPTSVAIKANKKRSRESLYSSIVSREGLNQAPLLYLEFGVYQGASIRHWLSVISHGESRFVGFDTFTGLPEHWRATEPLGHFDARGLFPKVADSRCSFEVGLFQDTLPAFIGRTDFARRLVINLDADMFTSTLFVLTSLGPFLKAGDLLFFDEFSCPLDEFRAFEEFAKSFRVKYEVLDALYGYTRVCIKVC